MEENQLLQELEKYWLSEKEAKVYLVLLELGNCIASTVANKSWINRATTYTILNSLKSRGYINETTKNDIKYYSAISPEMLLDDLEKKAQKFKNIVPDLLSLSWKYDNKPKVEYYDGFEWLKRVFEKVLAEWYNMNEPYLSFAWASINEDKRLDKYLNEEFIPARLKCPTKTKVIWFSNNNWDTYVKYNIETHESIIVNDELFWDWNEVTIYWDDKVVILLYWWENLGWVIIESKMFHNILKNIFNLMWKKIK